jgi:Protein of unknown function (DUF4242)
MTMAQFVVKRDLPGVTLEALQSAGLRAKTCCAEMTQEGQPVRWIRSFYMPETSQTHCYFEAANREACGTSQPARANSLHGHQGSAGDDAGLSLNRRQAPVAEASGACGVPRVLLSCWGNGRPCPPRCNRVAGSGEQRRIRLRATEAAQLIRRLAKTRIAGLALDHRLQIR